MRVYFDYNATTPLAAPVVDAVIQATRDQFGNASSVHHFGQQAKAALDEARSATAALLNADPSEIIFTSGGTEADNFAIRGAAVGCPLVGRTASSRFHMVSVLRLVVLRAPGGYRLALYRMERLASIREPQNVV